MLQRHATCNLIISCFLIVVPSPAVSSLNFKEERDVLSACLVRVSLALVGWRATLSLFGAISGGVVGCSRQWTLDGVVEPLAPCRERSPGFRGGPCQLLETRAIVSSGLRSGGGDSFEIRGQWKAFVDGDLQQFS
ncbi:hypothetical protein QBC32DRAFT_33505 [Pseudoneurospora amorphoporcata]|uniref:Secreted protein n=1 Tax=Pseudoneurospora amorphoporcata TaxID=241081 RepID=A0AAN6NPC8_9PEZI|nr:hypothetical protein QBC32DRAFT_33505 [Pseudoneurospora amorphoporcata]